VVLEKKSIKEKLTDADDADDDGRITMAIDNLGYYYKCIHIYTFWIYIHQFLLNNNQIQFCIIIIDLNKH